MKFGEYVGFIAGFFVFSTVLYYILVFTNKLPKAWNYGTMLIITATITIIGILLKRYLQ